MKVQHLIEYLLFQLLASVVRLFPLGTAQRTGAAVGDFLFSSVGFRRKITLDNLRQAYPEKNE